LKETPINGGLPIRVPRQRGIPWPLNAPGMNDLTIQQLSPHVIGSVKLEITADEVYPDRREASHAAFTVTNL